MKLLICCAAFGLALPCARAQDAPQVKPELVVETLASPAHSSSALPNVVRGADGHAYMTWVERSAGEGRLQLSRFDEGEWQAASEVLRAEDLFLNWADFPGVAVLPGGELVAYWLRNTEGRGAYNAEFALSTDAGKSWSAPRALHEDTRPAEHGFVSFAALDDETFAAIWLDGRAMVGVEHGAGEMALYARTLSASGELGEERVIDARVCDCCQTSLISTGAGELQAVYRDRSAEEVRDIGEARFAQGEWAPPRLVHDDGWVIPGCPVNGPRLAHHEGQVAAAWFTAGGESTGSVFVALRSKAGGEFGEPVQVDDGLPVGRVDIAYLDANCVLVSWLEHTGIEAEWRVRCVMRDGSRGPAALIAEVENERASGFLRMAVVDGQALAAWTTNDEEQQVECARISLQVAD